MNYKAVRLDRTSHFDRKTYWPDGKGAVVRAGDGDFTRTADGCGPGIHSSPTLLHAVGWQVGPSIYLAVEPIDVIQETEAKTRSKAVKIDHWLTPEETDELAGFKLWEANHPVNPLALKPKPFSEDELAELVRQWAALRASAVNSVLASVGASVGASLRAYVWPSFVDSVGASIRESVWASAGASFVDSVWASFGDSVWAYIGGLFPSVTSWKGAEHLGSDPWRPLLTLWYGGYLPSFDGETWRLHAGPDAAIVWEETYEPAEQARSRTGIAEGQRGGANKHDAKGR